VVKAVDSHLTNQSIDRPIDGTLVGAMTTSSQAGLQKSTKYSKKSIAKMHFKKYNWTFKMALKSCSMYTYLTSGTQKVPKPGKPCLTPTDTYLSLPASGRDQAELI